MQTAHIIEAVTAHLNKADANVIVIGSPHCRRPKVYAAADLPMIKAEGNGLRIGKFYAFACQVYFMKKA